MYNLGLGATLWEIVSSYAWWIVCNDMYSGLKCQLSGDAPQGSWSLINDVNCSGCVCSYPNPISATYMLLHFLFISWDGRTNVLLYFLETLQVRAPCHGVCCIVFNIDGILFEFFMNF